MTLDLAFVLRFILATFTVYRLAMLFTREDGPFAIFDAFRLQLGKDAHEEDKKGGIHWTLAELFNCPLCLGVWITFLVGPMVIWPHGWTDAILIILAIAGAESYLVRRSDET